MRCVLHFSGFLVVVGFLSQPRDGGGATPPNPNAWRTENNSSGACLATNRFVENSLLSPSTAEFPSMFGDLCANVTGHGGQRYTVRAYVDAQNGSGATVLTNYTVLLEQIGPDDFRLVELEM